MSGKNEISAAVRGSRHLVDRELLPLLDVLPPMELTNDLLAVVTTWGACP